MSIINELPVKPNPNGGDEVRNNYISERDAVSNREELKEFTNKWKAMWKLSHGKGTQLKEELELIDGSYNEEDAFMCLLTIRQGKNCKHVSGGVSCHAMHISVPVPLMVAEFVASQFEVPTDIALIQTNGGMKNFEWP